MKKFFAKSVKKFNNMFSGKKDDSHGPLGDQFAGINDALMRIKSSLHEHSFAVAARFEESEDSLAKLEAKCSVMENRIDKVLAECDLSSKAPKGPATSIERPIQVEESSEYPTSFSSHALLRIVDWSQKTRPEFWFVMNRQTKLTELMAAYCKQTNQKMAEVRFSFEGGRYSEYDLMISSPYDLNIYGGDTIHAIPIRDEEANKLFEESRKTNLSGSMLEPVRG